MFKNGMRPVHPGEVLREDFLRRLGMRVAEIANARRIEREIAPADACGIWRYHGAR